jgi:ribosomal protein S18 acetylase RimI-like enzyme
MHSGVAYNKKVGFQMSRVISLHDRVQIGAFLRRDAPLHLYALGDLDDFFWPATLWYGLEADDALRQVILGYLTDDMLVVHALTGGPLDELRELLARVRHLLPARIYAHLTPGVSDVLTEQYGAEPHGAYDKMLLVAPERLGNIDVRLVERLDAENLGEMLALYAASYPGNWFDPRMLETGHYYGLRVNGVLLSVAGVHVYSPQQRVAALGNIVTHPAARGRGYATQVTARLCQELLRTVDQIGLNVRAENAVAITCYQRLGFTRVAGYEEVFLTLRRPSATGR